MNIAVTAKQAQYEHYNYHKNNGLNMTYCKTSNAQISYHNVNITLIAKLSRYKHYNHCKTIKITKYEH